jgi:hypothetical protein
METIRLLVEAPTDTTDKNVTDVFEIEWDIVVESVYSLHTSTDKKFWVKAWPSRRISSLLDKIDKYGSMMIVYDMGYLGLNPKYWKVSRVHHV